MSESITDRLAQFVDVASSLPAPWGLEREPVLPRIEDALAVHIRLNGKLGRGIKGSLTLRLRAAGNLEDRSADDDILAIEVNATDENWLGIWGEAFPGYVHAINAYRGRCDRDDESAREWELSAEIFRKTGKDADGRDGPLRFAPVVFLDALLSKRACGGSSPQQVAETVEQMVHCTRLVDDGVLIVACPKPPDQREILDADARIRSALGIPPWTR